MTTRHATCSCGQLNLTIEGEPARVSMCHCLRYLVQIFQDTDTRSIA